ncbi:leucine--tRNA ligase [Candidatus Micrarchaeota archaeon]|nr:leucine--tRNA ligase [Candidatus Micrarchaeota archaeon]
MDTSSIEKKWQTIWAQKNLFDSEPDEREKKFVTAAFPYPNSPQHIGHARTYTTADIYARYLRLKGYNVLFPMAFHVTGTPILAMAKRIGKKDEDVLSVFEKIYGISREKAATLAQPRALVSYFSAEIEEGMKEMGFSIDWRRKFYSYDEKFNKFIQWQFRRLLQMGFVEQGEYPIAWCPSDSQAVSAHDTRGDVDPELEEVSVIKFEVSKSEYLVATTYRPETIYGVTNIWINPALDYVRAKYGPDTIILSKDAFDSLHLQLKLELIDSVSVEKLLKLKGKNPINGKKVPVYSASFVKSDVGTGVVMSVPAHAPLDYLALRDAGKTEQELINVLEVEGYGSAPAKEIVERLGVKDQNDPKSEEATKEIYTKEAHEGVMAIGEFKGIKAIIAKEKIAQKLKGESNAFSIHTISNGPVKCRCGAGVVVNIIKDQWFIDYGKPQWKEMAKEALSSMTVVPERSRQEYEYTLDWLRKRPCTRAAGLGTKFPLDESKMIEALSDSTIYMAFYTMSHLLADFESYDLTDELFDYVLLGKGEGSDKLAALRDSFTYWYPVDSRHSAGDLIRNHLTVYIFNHVALFEKKFWPRQIVTNGFVLMDGTKMSKSMGNILPLRKAIAEYGADVVRFSVVAGAELASDTDFNRSVADGVKGRMDFIEKLIIASSNDLLISSRMDDWILSRLNRRISGVAKLYDQLAMRELAMEIFYDSITDLQWYAKRNKRTNLKQFFQKWLVLLSPIMPHFAQEFWQMLGNKDFVCQSDFPKADTSLIRDNVEQGEELIKSVHSDVERIAKLIGKSPTKVTLVVAADWKRELYEIARKLKSFEGIMKEASAKGMPMKDVGTLAKQLMKNIHSLGSISSGADELESLKDASEFLSSELSCQIEILAEDSCTHAKAKAAMPNKPAIILE